MDTHKTNAGVKRNNIMWVSTRSFSNDVVNADEQRTRNESTPHSCLFNDDETSATSGRATSSPTGERSAGRSPAAEPTSVTTNQTNVTNDATHDNLSVTEPIKTPDVPLTENQRVAQAELDFLDDDSEITFDDNNSEILNSIDVSDIGPNIVIPGGGVGLTPTGQVFSNSSENVLNNQKNVVSSNGEYVIEFIDKYIDDNNNKIC